MSDLSDHELNRIVGGLSAGFSSLERQVHALLETWQRQDMKASEGRNLTHAKMDQLSADVAAVKEAMGTLGPDSYTIQRNFSQLNDWVAGCDAVKRQGFKTVTSVIVTGLLGALVYWFRDIRGAFFGN